MTTLDASAVARLLREFGQRTALRGDNPFRAKAYARAADNLLTLSEPLGPLLAKGPHPGLERMREEVPQGVLDLLTIPGLRPDKIIKLHRELGVTSLDEL